MYSCKWWIAGLVGYRLAVYQDLHLFPVLAVVADWKPDLGQ